jgi:hypothetical protein
MPNWTCPKCHRGFARSRQSHECAPAMTLDEYFSTGPERERPIFDAVMAHLATLGEVQVEPVSVGIFIKKSGSFIELRPMQKWVAMTFPLRRRLQHPRIRTKPIDAGRRTYHRVDLREPTDLDDTIKEWLTESWMETP